jgi:hypothetical protein
MTKSVVAFRNSAHAPNKRHRLLDELKLYLGSFVVAGGSSEQKKLRSNKVIHAVKADALLNYAQNVHSNLTENTISIS